MDYFQKSPLGGRPNTKPENYGILNTRNLFYFIMGENLHEEKFIEIAFG
jgi:hypothetical protein